MTFEKGLRCPRHPNYKAVHPPAVNCERCWLIYWEKRGDEPAPVAPARKRRDAEDEEAA